MTRSRKGFAVVALGAAAAMVLAGCAQQSNQGAPAGGAGQPSVGFPETAPVGRGRRQARRRVPPGHHRADRDRHVQRAGVRGRPDHERALHRARPASSRTARSSRGGQRLDAERRLQRCGRSTSSRTRTSPTARSSTPPRSSAAGSATRRPTRGSEVAYHLDEIQGYTEFQAGKAPTWPVSRDPPPNQLAVTLTQPDCEFHLRTNHPVARPGATTVGATTNSTYTDAPIGNGPFKIEGKWNARPGHQAGPQRRLRRR